MQIIRDDNQDGIDTPAISMIPVLTQWKIKRCNIKDCTNNPTTIVAGTEAGVFGMCEHHYQEAIATKGNYEMNLEW